MSLAILGLFKAISPLFPTTARRFAPAGGLGLVDQNIHPPLMPTQRQRRIPEARPADGRPLRVTRMLDQGSATSCAGRMVMSGRFDDVCAELDRLVALESAREASRTRH